MHATERAGGLPTSIGKSSARARPRMRIAGRRGFASASRLLLDILGLPPETPHEQVRQAYLFAAMQTHPDQNDRADAADRMAELQAAWVAYRQQTRLPTDGAHGFTDFGVGCSFDDSEEEQRQRSAVMDQASRGRINQRALPPDRGRESE